MNLWTVPVQLPHDDASYVLNSSFNSQTSKLQIHHVRLLTCVYSVLYYSSSSTVLYCTYSTVSFTSRFF